ncbi:MAG: TatD family hydrolase [Akkermansiaceae bacterium]|jgi:TatD DNase family protein
MIDIHNHLQDSRFDGKRDDLIDEMKAEGITSCVVNGTSENDWPDVARLAKDHPGFVIPAFGLHPWNVTDRSPGWLEKLTGFLGDHPEAIVGECGLDRWMKNPDLDSQHRVFRDQMELALTLNRPVTIHCLNAWGALLDELTSFPKLPRFLLHSFGGSLEVARQCEKLGAYFSFSGYFLEARKAAVRDVFARLDPTRILVETDAPDMAPPEPTHHLGTLNHPANLAAIASQLSKVCGISVSDLDTNACRFLGRER